MMRGGTFGPLRTIAAPSKKNARVPFKAGAICCSRLALTRLAPYSYFLTHWIELQSSRQCAVRFRAARRRIRIRRAKDRSTGSGLVRGIAEKVKPSPQKGNHRDDGKGKD
jgi:hypothetical protein